MPKLKFPDGIKFEFIWKKKTMRRKLTAIISTNIRLLKKKRQKDVSTFRSFLVIRKKRKKCGGKVWPALEAELH